MRHDMSLHSKKAHYQPLAMSTNNTSWNAAMNGSVEIFSNGYKGAIAGHDYAASAANCWNADRPLVRNWRFLIMWATSMPSNVANADWKDLKPFIGRVSFLIKRWSCSIILLRYLTCRTSINQNHPCNSSSRFMFCNPARLAPLLSITTFSGVITESGV